MTGNKDDHSLHLLTHCSSHNDETEIVQDNGQANCQQHRYQDINKIQSWGTSQGVTAAATFYNMYVPGHNAVCLHVQLLSFVVTLFMVRPKQTSFGTILLDTAIFGLGKNLLISNINTHLIMDNSEANVGSNISRNRPRDHVI